MFPKNSPEELIMGKEEKRYQTRTPAALNRLKKGRGVLSLDATIPMLPAAIAKMPVKIPIPHEGIKLRLLCHLISVARQKQSVMTRKTAKTSSAVLYQSF